MSGSRFGEVLSQTTKALFGKRMIIAKSQKDLDKMRAVGELIAEVREALRAMVAPGVTTLELNATAEKMMRDAGSIPTFIGYKPRGMVPFPYAICASPNEAIVLLLRPIALTVISGRLSCAMAAPAIIRPVAAVVTRTWCLLFMSLSAF